MGPNNFCKKNITVIKAFQGKNKFMDFVHTVERHYDFIHTVELLRLRLQVCLNFMTVSISLKFGFIVYFIETQVQLPKIIEACV